MREKRPFAQRSSVSGRKEALRKYFLVYEGENTESIYFDGIIANRDKIGINPLIELVPVIRSYSEEGWSNPKKLIDRVQLNLEESAEGVIFCETLLNWIMEYLSDEGIIRNNRTAAKAMWNTLLSICSNDLHINLNTRITNPDDVCSDILEFLRQKTQWSSIMSNVALVITEGRGILFEENFDKICFIIDRDRESFISKDGNDQYTYVLNKCRENNYGFYLSNPCFEFWLLMHFDEVTKLDPVNVLNNPRVTSKRRYLENELRRLLPGFSKSKYRIDPLMANIDKAIRNEKLFCEDEEALLNTAGSRVGLLITELRTN